MTETTLTRAGAMPAPATAPAPERWPALATRPQGPRARVAARVAASLLRQTCRRLGIAVVDDGVTPMPGVPTIVVHDADELFLRLGTDGLIGLGEAWLAGAWDSPDLAAVVERMAGGVDTLVPGWMQRLRRLHVAREPRRHRNTVAQSQSNIAHHYDLSNDLFRLFLDETLSYSSALFTDLPPGEESLADAQRRKIDRLLDRTGVGPGTRVLEIGTGWGELAIRAASRGATVRTVTLSTEQRDLALERIAEAGLADRVQVDLLDYRLVEGAYDVVLSVEMIEAVGDEYWSTYFRKVDRLLVPGGRFGLQAILMPHRRMLATRHDFTFIKKYIFPGGILPSVEAIDAITSRETALRVTDRLAFGRHYAETLRQWDQRFAASRDRVLALGFDETFVRMWHFYLRWSQGGFAGDYIDVQQITFTKEQA